MTLRDNFDNAIDHFEGGLFVDGVGRDADVGSPPLRVSQGVRREEVQVREDREVDDSQGAVVSEAWIENLWYPILTKTERRPAPVPT